MRVRRCVVRPTGSDEIYSSHTNRAILISRILCNYTHNRGIVWSKIIPWITSTCARREPLPSINDDYINKGSVNGGLAASNRLQGGIAFNPVSIYQPPLNGPITVVDTHSGGHAESWVSVARCGRTIDRAILDVRAATEQHGHLNPAQSINTATYGWAIRIRPPIIKNISRIIISACCRNNNLSTFHSMIRR